VIVGHSPKDKTPVVETGVWTSGIRGDRQVLGAAILDFSITTFSGKVKSSPG
jgi:hypothetical protein